MRSDVNGSSTCKAGEENFESYHSDILGRELVQYDYRTPGGELFSTVAPTLEIARSRRDKWLGEDGEPKPEPRWLSTVETAKLIRKALKTRFPETKFSVRSKSYAGGSSISIRWSDGPTAAAVEAITDGFAGRGFDGSIDLGYFIDAWLLPDGTTAPAKSIGTAGSRGSVAAFDNPKPDPDAELVHFQAGFVFASRRTTLDRERIARDLCDLQGVEFVGLDQRELLGAGDRWDLREHVERALAQTTIPEGGSYAGVRFAESDDVRVWCEIYFE